MKFLPLVWRNLLRRKIRTTFTILSIVVAFVLFGVLMAIRVAFTLGIDVAGADRLVMIHKVSFIQPLPVSYKDRIASVDGVKAVTHQTWMGAYYQDPKNFFPNMAVEPEVFLEMYPEFVLPEEQKKAWFANRGGAIIGIDLAKRFGWKVGDRIPLTATIWRKADDSPWEFTIDGIYDSPVKGTDKTQFFFHYKYLDETRQFGQGQVGWYVIRVHEAGTSDQLAQRIDGLFANSPAETKTSTEKAFVQAFAKQIGDIGAIMMAIASVVMLFIMLVAGNAMAQSIRERTNELAILKTLGFGDGLILALVLLESCLIAVIGGGIGLFLSWLIARQGDPTGGMLPAFYLPTRDLVAGVVLVALLGLATGLLPALQASRMKIVDALRRT